MKTDYKLWSEDKLTELARSHGVKTWNELTDFIKRLPYGRNKNRTDFGLVFSEQKGTCSSKHALLKSVADSNNIKYVDLVIGIYKTTEWNTPGIGTELTLNSIEFIPEAHCYLMINKIRVDCTSEYMDFNKIEKDIIQERIIEPSEIAEFKINYHKKFIKDWLKDGNTCHGFDEIWQVREKCIENLSE